jgi:hypothetical protein
LQLKISVSFPEGLKNIFHKKIFFRGSEILLNPALDFRLGDSQSKKQPLQAFPHFFKSLLTISTKRPILVGKYPNMKQIKSLVFLLLISINFNALSAQEIDYAEDPKAWVELRIENAQKGKKELIETPFAVRSRAWGCKCPDYYLGESTNVAEGPWVQPLHPEKLPPKNEEGHALIVQGYFTGRIITIDLRNENKEPKEWLYQVPEFKIISWHYNEEDWQGLIPKILKK